MFLPRDILQATIRAYARQTGLRATAIMPDGKPVYPSNPTRHDAFARMPAAAKIRAEALQQALHWGEPYIFFPLFGVASWVVPLADGHALRGGLIGGEVKIEGDSEAQSLAGASELGFSKKAAMLWLRRLPGWPKPRIRETAVRLRDIFYAISGWQPLLLDENRLKARRTEQMAVALNESADVALQAYPIEKERQLLSLIRAGDRNGARRLLNEMLGSMYMSSPKLPVLRARAIEMMGYLGRAAVEDSPMMETLLNRNLRWSEKLIRARDFETLSYVLVQALDDFMDGIYLHGFAGGNQSVTKLMDYIQRHYSGPVVMAEASRYSGLSASRASHLLRQHTGRTLMQHVMRLRVQKAQQLLTRSNSEIADIAARLGFCDQSYFTKHFRRITGVTPARYRRGQTGMASG